MRTWRYSLTFERPLRPDEPERVEGEVVATGPAAALARAYRDAVTRRTRRMKWDDILIVLWPATLGEEEP